MGRRSPGEVVGACVSILAAMGILLLIERVAGAGSPGNTDLSPESLAGQHPILIVFASSVTSQKCTAQQDVILASATALRQRGVVAMYAPAEPPRFLGRHTLSAVAAQRARLTYSIGPKGFCVLLVGLDGRTKFRSDRPLGTRELLALIDAAVPSSRKRS